MQWFLNFKNGEGQLATFLETLSAYTLKVEYRAGRVHNNADAMSRRPCYDTNCQYCFRYETRYGSDPLVETQPQLEGETAVKGMNVEQVRSATTNQNSVEHKISAISKDDDPVLFTGPLCMDDSFSGRAAMVKNIGAL